MRMVVRMYHVMLVCALMFMGYVMACMPTTPGAQSGVSVSYGVARFRDDSVRDVVCWVYVAVGISCVRVPENGRE